VDANPAAVELSSYDSREELLHVDITPYLLTSPGTIDQVEQTLLQRGFVKDFEFVIKRRDGRKLTALGSVTAVGDENGEE
jgi:PAS domain-containing protein